MKDCLFCRIAAGEVAAQLVHRDEHCVAFDDINPKAPVHTLIVPVRHIATLDDAGEEDVALLGHLLAVASRVAAGKGLASRGYRLVLNCRAEAGQSVFHLHVHLLGGRAMGWPPG
jgi:histidine triad (HIT) family protein